MVSRFTKDWDAALQSGKALLFPPYRPTTLLTTDVSNRESNCRVCDGTIAVKSKRIVCMVRVSPSLQSNGGVIMGKKFFYHQACFTSFTGNRKNDPYNKRCSRCGKFKKIADLRGLFASRSHIQLSWVCGDCVKRENILSCVNCGRLALHPFLSPSSESNSSVMWGTNQNLVAGNLVCDSCAASWYIMRAKEKRKQDIEDAKFEKKLFEIRELMIKNEFWPEEEPSGGK